MARLFALLCILAAIAVATTDHEDRMYKIAQRGEEQRETAEMQRYLIITFGALSFSVAFYNLCKGKKREPLATKHKPREEHPFTNDSDAFDVFNY